MLRGFALLGIFIMNMPGFTPFALRRAGAGRARVDAVAAALRELFFAGKFNLLFGLLFGIGFALQMKRLERDEAARASGRRRRDPHDRRRSTRAGSASLLAIGLVHAIVFWPGDVLVVYALLGFALLARACAACRTARSSRSSPSASCCRR